MKSMGKLGNAYLFALNNEWIKNIDWILKLIE